MSINSTITNPTINWQSFGGSLFYKILFWSSYVKDWIVSYLTTQNIPLNETQVQILLAIITLLLIAIGIKMANQVAKPIIVWIIIGLLVWFFVGFWA